MKAPKLDRNHTTAAVVLALALAATIAGATAFAADTHTTGKFEGVKANTGMAIHSKEGGRNVLTLTDDFVVPDAPAPHWQVVDSKGRVYLLNRLLVKDPGVPMERQMDRDSMKYNKRIVVPSYVPDIAKVQIWCAWAEVLLGEASFEQPVK